MLHVRKLEILARGNLVQSLLYMTAPTAVIRRPQDLAKVALSLDSKHRIGSDDIPIDSTISSDTVTTSVCKELPHSFESGMSLDAEGRPSFVKAIESKHHENAEVRKIIIPPHRIAPLKVAWPKIYPPMVEKLNLQVRMNVKAKAVEIRTSLNTTESGSLQKGEDFIKAFSLGFDVEDAIALLRLDDLYIETFEIKDVKTLHGEHLGRAIGRIAGKDGRTKFAIENASKTRVVLADQKIHILGGFKNIHVAREAIVSLILGSPPGKVYGNLRTVAKRMKERF